MARMTAGVQQGHGHAAVAIGAGLGQGLLQRPIQLQRLQFLPVRRQAAADFDHPQGQGLGPQDLQGEEIGAVLIADALQVGEATVDQQQHRRHLALQQGVGGHGGAQAHLRHRPGRNGLVGRQGEQLAQGGHGGIHRGCAVRRQRRIGEPLAYQKLTAGGAGHHIGEGAPPVNPEPPAGAGHVGGPRQGGVGSTGGRKGWPSQNAGLPLMNSCISSASIMKMWPTSRRGKTNKEEQ